MRAGISFLVLALFSTGLGWSQGLEYPVDVAVDAQGVVFVADPQSHALLKFEAGSYRVVAKGEGLPRTPLFGIRHIALDKESRWVVSDPATMKLYRIDSQGKITPVPDDDQLVTPWGVGIEPSGNILVVDRATHSLRRITPAGEVSEVATVHAPRAIVFGKEGRILVLTDRNLMSVADGGDVTPIVEARPFELAHDAVLHPNGNYYVTDGYAGAVWQITPRGEVTVLVQGEPLKSPQGLAVDLKGDLLVADAHAKAVFRVTPTGKISALGQ